MSELFKKALGHVILNEGGFNDVKGDRGGATNFGISLVFLKSLPQDRGDINKDGIIDAKDIRALNIEEVGKIYKEHFWDRYVQPIKNWRLVPHRDQVKDEEDLLIYLFDMFVNHSPKAVNRMLQRAIASVLKLSDLVEDGVLGDRSRELLKQCRADILLVALRCERHAYYRELVAKDPVQDKFFRGWRRRALEG